jgi:hypothetical protein
MAYAIYQILWNGLGLSYLAFVATLACTLSSLLSIFYLSVCVFTNRKQGVNYMVGGGTNH